MDFKFSDSETQMFKDLSDIFILERAGKIISKLFIQGEYNLYSISSSATKTTWYPSNSKLGFCS